MQKRQLPDHFQLVDLREKYDEELLTYFYDNVMRKFFPIEDELDPLEAWTENIRPEQQQKDELLLLPDMHVCILFDTRSFEDKNHKFHTIAAATVWEYYKFSNTGLLSYILVDDKYRSLGLSKYMTMEAFNSCKQAALNYRTEPRFQAAYKQQINFTRIDSLKGTDKYYYQRMLLASNFNQSFFAFFAETNAYNVDDGVMPAPIRHDIMRKIGFRMLDFDYIQPPLSDEQDPCADLLLLALDVPDLPVDTQKQRTYIPTITVEAFLLEFAYSVTEETSFLDEDYCQYLVKDLIKRGHKLYLSTAAEIPWVRRTMWQPGEENNQQTLTSKL